ncbi:retroviral-like aspartic protease family protein [Sphingomonas sp. ERG5]|uniref:retroviral-like aspartic protease family protein n=1 Tax=Sphingomonas sp. ERG5 TaxID=1381597 RepID=UPI0009DDF52C
MTINGVTWSMPSDSGATTVALSEATARAAKVTVDRRHEPIEVQTASGSMPVENGTLVPEPTERGQECGIDVDLT